MEANRASSNGARRTGAVELPGSRRFTVDVQRRDDVAIVQPQGELDLATVDTLRAALDGLGSPGAWCSTCAACPSSTPRVCACSSRFTSRAQRDGFQLTLVAPAAPADKAIQMSGLDQTLPFVHGGMDRRALVTRVDAAVGRPKRLARIGSPRGRRG